jgi:hypothetical protein
MESATVNVAETISLAFYAATLALFVVVALLRGGSSERANVAYLAGSLLGLFLVGLWRHDLLFDERVGMILTGAWLNLSTLLGTRMNPFRLTLNSADLARLAGPWPDKSARPRDPRFVKPPVRAPTLILFFSGAAIIALVESHIFSGLR